MERNIALSQRENYAPSRFTELLWWLSTAEKEIIIDAVVDRNRYLIIGMTLLATWIFASIAWILFFISVTDSMSISFLAGLFMGFIILTIDRALIKGINRSNKRKLFPLLIRGLLALTIGTFMAQPAVLYMFDKEIKMQASLDNEKRKQTKRKELDNLFSERKLKLMGQRVKIRTDMERKYAEVTKARENFLAETDGSGGSGKIGIKDIALAKKNEYLKMEAEYQVMQKEDQPKLESADKELNDMENTIKGEETTFAKFLNNGFLTRAEALNNLLKNEPALQFRYYLIVFILLLIELMPVLAKSMLPSGSYDERVAQREEMELQLAGSNRIREQTLKECYNQLAFEKDQEAIIAFFRITSEDRNEKMRFFGKAWKDENVKTFDGLWEKIKNDIMTKQEN